MPGSDNTTPHFSKDFDHEVRNTIPYYESFHKETINIIKATAIEPDIWLDTGCGTGSLIELAIEKFPHTKFILSDPSARMLDQARKKLSKYPKDRLKFLDPIPTQEFSSESFKKADVVTAIQSHHYLSPKDRLKATKVCYDILNEYGVYITFENTRPATDKGIEIGREYWKNFQLSRGRSGERAENHMERFDVGYFPITIAEHLKLLGKTGFRVVELLWFSYMQAGFYAIK
jgi:tRNA (cmo5U34)-methyltransferase